MNILNAAGMERATDDAGTPVPHAERHVFVAGTDTLSPLYADPGLTHMLPNPMKADGEGRFALCYLLDGKYDVVLRDPRRKVELDRLTGFTVRSAYSATSTARFETVGALLESPMVDYAGAARAVTLTPGDFVDVTDGGHRYRVVADTATDHHLTTVRGVKLRVEPALGNIWSLAAFGADLTGTTDETERVQLAMDAAGAARGTLFHPGGEVRCVGVTGRAGVTVAGIGAQSVFARGAPDGSDTVHSIMDWADGESTDVTVRDCAFDLRSNATLSGADLDQGSDGDFANALHFDDFTEAELGLSKLDAAAKTNRVRVTDCVFFDSNHETAGNWTLTAVTARGINDLSVSRNICRGTQIKLAGSDVSSFRLSCEGNIIHRAQAYAVSAVVREGASGEPRYLSDVVIRGNIAYGNGSRCPAYYTGADEPAGGHVTCTNILVAENSGHMQWADSTTGPSFAFIKHRGGSVGACSNVAIVNNAFTDDGGPSALGARGIVADGAGITIRGNLVHANLDQAAIRASQNSRVLDNAVRGENRGIEFEVAGDGVLIAVGNTLDGEGVNQPRILADVGAHAVTLHLNGNAFIDCAVGTAEYQKQPISLVADGGTITGIVSANTVIDRGNTAHAVDENDRGGSTFAAIYTGNHFGTPKFAKRLQTPDTNLYGNTGGFHARGAQTGPSDFTAKTSFQAGLHLKDGIGEPAGDGGFAALYVDDADGALKVKFGNGTVQTIVASS